MQSLEQFLASIERRAFSIARSSLGNREDALDVVQEAMTQLVARYSNKNPDEWRPLFYRILQSKINDLHRRHKVQNKVKGWLNRFRGKDDGAVVEEDPFQNVPGPEHYAPHFQHEASRQLEILQSASTKGRTPRFFMFVTGTALASVIALILVLSPNLQDNQTVPAGQDKILLSEGIDLYEDMDFYYWLASEESHLNG